MEFADLNGITIAYRRIERGADRPWIVFANSLGTDARIWDKITDLLAPAYNTLVYDKRGHGLSDSTGPRIALGDHVTDLENLMDRLGLSGAVICGLSVGGMIAQGLAGRRPDLARALVLCGTAPRIGTAAGWNARIAAIEGAGMGSVADGILKLWFSPDFGDERAAELAGYRNMLLRTPVEGYIATCTAIRDIDLTETTRTLAQPTLCIVGEYDGATPPDLVRQLANLIPRARFSELPDAGHLPCAEQPVMLSNLITDFIKGLAP